MFVTRKEFERRLEYKDNEIERLRNKFWELHNAHYALLSHLGLEEVETPAKVELRPIQPKSGLGGDG